MNDYAFLSGPLRLSMLLAVEGKPEAAAAMLARYKAEILERMAVVKAECREAIAKSEGTEQ